MSHHGYCIGIDIGTSNCRAAVFRNGDTELIPIENGNTSMPSYVTFTKEGIFVGKKAKELEIPGQLKTIFNSKRMIGRHFTDPALQSEIEQLPFTFEEKKSGSPSFIVSTMDIECSFLPEEISAMLLTDILEAAKLFLGVEVKSAVITVPAFFNDAQRRATREVGTLAGLEVLQILNEPSAVGLTYGLPILRNGSKDRKEIVLVVDMGAGSFDVSLMKISKGQCRVISAFGNVRLGGFDFDNRLAAHFASVIKKEYGQDITTDKSAMRILRRECQRLKEELSDKMRGSIKLKNVLNRRDSKITFTRKEFEMMFKDIFDNILETVQASLKEANVLKSEVNGIVLAGGSTRIPMIQKGLSEYFDGRDVGKFFKREGMVASGAAIQAALLTGDLNKSDEKIKLSDVSPLTLGVEVAGGEMHRLIKRNSSLPARITKHFSTFEDNQKHVKIKIFEGERRLTVHNNLLGSFYLEGIQRAKKAIPKIHVTFNLDENGILDVTGADMTSGSIGSLKITNDNDRWSVNEVERVVNHAQKFRKKRDLMLRNESKTWDYVGSREDPAKKKPLKK